MSTLIACPILFFLSFLSVVVITRAESDMMELVGLSVAQTLVLFSAVYIDYSFAAYKAIIFSLMVYDSTLEMSG